MNQLEGLEIIMYCPCLWKTSEISNNRNQALQKLKYLTNELEKYLTFFGHYKELMDVLFERGQEKNLVNLLLRANAGMFHTMQSTMTISLTELELCLIAAHNK